MSKPPSRLRRKIAMLSLQYGSSDPDNVYGCCVDAAYFVASKFRDAGVVHLLGNKTPQLRRHPDYPDYYPAIDPCLYHCVCRVGEWFVDLTWKQLDIAAELPYKMQTGAELRADWKHITKRSLV